MSTSDLSGFRSLLASNADLRNAAAAALQSGPDALLALGAQHGFALSRRDLMLAGGADGELSDAELHSVAAGLGLDLGSLDLGQGLGLGLNDLKDRKDLLP